MTASATSPATRWCASMGTVANQAIGADQAWAGTLPGVGSVTGRGIGVAFFDSGYSRHQALKDAIWRGEGFHRGERHRRGPAGARHAHRRADRQPVGRGAAAWRRGRGW